MSEADEVCRTLGNGPKSFQKALLRADGASAFPGIQLREQVEMSELRAG